MINIFLSILILWIFSWLFVRVDEIVDNVISFVNRKILKKKLTITRGSGDIFKDLMKVKKNFRYYYLFVYRFFMHIADFPEDTYREARWAYQRVTRKWDDTAVWSIDWFLTEILPPMLKRLKKTKHGCPILPGYSSEPDGNISDKTYKEMKKEWEYILGEMIYTFTVARNIQEEHWHYQNSNKYSIKLANSMRKLQEQLRARRKSWYGKKFGHVMTKEECIRYEHGWAYFQKHFFDLWD